MENSLVKEHLDTARPFQWGRKCTKRRVRMNEDADYDEGQSNATYGAFPLHGTVRLGTVRYGTAQFGSVCVSTAV